MLARAPRRAREVLLRLARGRHLVQLSLIKVGQIADRTDCVGLARHVTLDTGPLLGFQVILYVLKICLLVLQILNHANIAHIFSAEDSEIVQGLGHIHDTFANLTKAQRDLHVVINPLVSRRQLTLADDRLISGVGEEHIF